MPITADEATEIADEHGLNLSDAVAIQQLADDADHARQIAVRFAPQQHEPTADEIADEIRRRQGDI